MLFIGCWWVVGGYGLSSCVECCLLLVVCGMVSASCVFDACCVVCFALGCCSLCVVGCLTFVG